MLASLRSSESAAATIGVRIVRSKLLTFGLSSFVAGLGGALYRGHDRPGLPRQLQRADGHRVAGHRRQLRGPVGARRALIAGIVFAVVPQLFASISPPAGRGADPAVRRRRDRLAINRRGALFRHPAAGLGRCGCGGPAAPRPSRSGTRMSGPLLDAREIRVSFGGVSRPSPASTSPSPPGRCVGLVGPNGAGKTTLFGVLSGLVSPRGGRVELDGVDVTRASPQRRARLGLARTFQRLELFDELTVREHLVVARRIREHRDRTLLRDLVGLGRRPVARRGRRRRPRSSTCWTSASRGPAGARRCRSARAGSSSSAAPWRPSPGWCCSTSRPRVWTSTRPSGSRRRCASARAERGVAFVLVEHDVELVLQTVRRRHGPRLRPGHRSRCARRDPGQRRRPGRLPRHRPRLGADRDDRATARRLGPRRRLRRGPGPVRRRRRGGAGRGRGRPRAQRGGEELARRGDQRPGPADRGADSPRRPRRHRLAGPPDERPGPGVRARGAGPSSRT